MGFVAPTTEDFYFKYLNKRVAREQMHPIQKKDLTKVMAGNVLGQALQLTASSLGTALSC